MAYRDDQARLLESEEEETNAPKEVTTDHLAKDKSEAIFNQKISGKAWGILQFRKLRLFPYSVFFIVGNEFCERFSFWGMAAILALFLNEQLGFSEDSSTAIYHAFAMLSSFFPLMGAIISDSCLGKYWTIMTLSVVHAIGNILVAIGAIPFQRGVSITLVAIGLFTLALGTGGIKPCISAFGGDQFKEDQTDMLRRFFSLFYFSINTGSTISTLITPVLRSQVHCFGTDWCYSLAFAIPAVIMVLSIIMFIIGTRFYIRNKPKREEALLFFHVLWCVVVAVYKRIKYGKVIGKKNLLQYAVPKYTERFAQDVWMVLRVTIMITPMLAFWALNDQVGSRWIFQAAEMNGRIGKLTILPDQMPTLDPILVLLFIPFFEAVVYPVFAKCHLFRKPLQRMTVGLIASALAFVVAGFVELKIQSADTSLRAGEGKIIFTNALPYEIQLQLQVENETAHFDLTHGESYSYRTCDLGNWNTTVFVNDSIAASFDVEISDQNITHAIIVEDGGNLSFTMYEYKEFLPDEGRASVQVISTLPDDDGEILFNFYLCKTDCYNSDGIVFGAPNLQSLSPSNFSNIPVGSYYYLINTSDSENVTANLQSQVTKLETRLDVGALYTLVLVESVDASTSFFNVTVVEVDPPNSVSLFLQVPMYVLLKIGEVMAYITSVEFSYSQAPPSMKSICQAVNLMASAIGNLIVIVVAESSPFSNQAIEFFFFAGFMAVFTLLFMVMAYFYKYANPSHYETSTNGNSDSNPTERTSLMDEDVDEEGETVI